MRKIRSHTGYRDEKELKLKEATWDYQMPKPVPIYGLQTDWNQTIVTKLNQIWATNRPFDGLVKMTIPNKFKPIFESLLYYDQLQTRYEIEYTDTNVDNLNVGGCILSIKNFKNNLK